MIAVTIAQNAGINLWRVRKLTDYISITGKGSYELRFKSTDYSEFREIEETARAIMDRHTDTHDSDHVSMDKHHKKTYAQDFFEKFPNAEEEDVGIPSPCRGAIYGFREFSCCDKYVNCTDCWREIMKDS